MNILNEIFNYKQGQFDYLHFSFPEWEINMNDFDDAFKEIITISLNSESQTATGDKTEGYNLSHC